MNSLNIDLDNKFIVMEGDGDEERRTVKVIGGFGAKAQLRGRTIFVEDKKGHRFSVNGMEVEKLAFQESQLS